jgi:hypothetical protein
MASMEVTRNTIRVFFGKPEEKTSLGRTTHLLDHSIKMDDKVIGWSDTGRTFLSHGRDQWPFLVRTAKKLRVA